MQEKSYKVYTFGRVNLYLFLFSMLLIVLGYILMAGGKSPDGVRFNPEVFSAGRIVIAPVLCALGYIGVLLAILWRGRRVDRASEDKE